MAHRIGSKIPPKVPETHSGQTFSHTADSFASSEASFKEGKKEALQKLQQEREQKEALKKLSKPSLLADLFRELDRVRNQTPRNPSKEAEILERIKTLQEPLESPSEGSDDEIEFFSAQSHISEPQVQTGQPEVRREPVPTLDTEISKFNQEHNQKLSTSAGDLKSLIALHKRLETLANQQPGRFLGPSKTKLEQRKQAADLLKNQISTHLTTNPELLSQFSKNYDAISDFIRITATDLKNSEFTYDILKEAYDTLQNTWTSRFAGRGQTRPAEWEILEQKFYAAMASKDPQKYLNSVKDQYKEILRYLEQNNNELNGISRDLLEALRNTMTQAIKNGSGWIWNSSEVEKAKKANEIINRALGTSSLESILQEKTLLQKKYSDKRASENCVTYLTFIDSLDECQKKIREAEKKSYDASNWVLPKGVVGESPEKMAADAKLDELRSELQTIENNLNAIASATNQDENIAEFQRLTKDLQEKETVFEEWAKALVAVSKIEKKLLENASLDANLKKRIQEKAQQRRELWKSKDRITAWINAYSEGQEEQAVKDLHTLCQRAWSFAEPQLGEKLQRTYNLLNMRVNSKELENKQKIEILKSFLSEQGMSESVAKVAYSSLESEEEKIATSALNEKQQKQIVSFKLRPEDEQILFTSQTLIEEANPLIQRLKESSLRTDKKTGILSGIEYSLAEKLGKETQDKLLGLQADIEKLKENKNALLTGKFHLNAALQKIHKEEGKEGQDVIALENLSSYRMLIEDKIAAAEKQIEQVSKAVNLANRIKSVIISRRLKILKDETKHLINLRNKAVESLKAARATLKTDNAVALTKIGDTVFEKSPNKQTINKKINELEKENKTAQTYADHLNEIFKQQLLRLENEDGKSVQSKQLEETLRLLNELKKSCQTKLDDLHASNEAQDKDQQAPPDVLTSITAENLEDQLEAMENFQKTQATELNKSLNKQKLQKMLRETNARIAALEGYPERWAGMVPLDDWTPWLLDLSRDVLGIQWGRRDATTQTQHLAWEMLWADQGMNTKEAYTALGKSLLKFINITDPNKQAEEFAKLVKLPGWVWDNPRLARQFIANIQRTIQALSNDTDNKRYGSIGTMARNITSIVATDSWAQAILQGNYGERDQSMSKEGLALLHLSYHAPTLIGAATAGKDSYLGQFLGTFSGKAGGFAGDTLTGGVKQAFSTAVASYAIENLPGEAGAMIQGLSNLAGGSNMKQEATLIVGRGFISEVMTFVRNVLDPKRSAFTEIKENFKSWWKYSGWKEKAWRGISQYAPVVGGIAAVAVGGVLTATGLGAAIGIPMMIYGGYAVAGGTVMRFLNEHGVGKLSGTTEKVLAAQQKRDRDRRLMSEEAYLNLIKSTPYSSKFPPEIPGAF